MIHYIVKRFFHLLFILLGVSFLSFLLMSLTPGDFLTSLSLNPQIPAQTVEKLRKEFGLDQPWYIQYVRWLGNISPIAIDTSYAKHHHTFPLYFKIPDLGYSFSYRIKVTTLIWSRFFNTILLSLTAEFIIWTLAIPLGLLCAAKEKKWLDKIISFCAFTGLALPEVLLGLLALMFAAATQWFPIGGMTSSHYEELTVFQKLVDVAHHLILPAFVLAFTSIASIIRYSRGAFLDAMHAPFITALKAKGLPSHTIMYKHVLRNAVNPLITLFGYSFAGLVSSSFIVEVIMSWPGLGLLTLESMFSKDLYVINASVLLATLFLVTGNLIADILLAFVDPRIRLEKKSL
jgi:peptide/nickel transport system permease protein